MNWSSSASASWPARRRTLRNGVDSWAPVADPLTCGRFAIAASTAARSPATFAPARASTGSTMPSRASSRAASRWSGSTTGLPRSPAIRADPAIASWARSVGLSTAI